MKKQCFILGLAFLLGGISCTKERINSTKPTVSTLADSSMLTSFRAKDNHKPSRVTVSTFAGSGQDLEVDGVGILASFNRPVGIALDNAGNLYVSDDLSATIRKINKDAVVTTLAGNGSLGFADGQGTAAAFNFPGGLAVDSSGNIYVADSGNNRIRKISPTGLVTTFAGNGARGSADGICSAASFDTPWGVTIDSSGNLYVTDQGNNKIRKITPDGVVTTFAGSGAKGKTNGKAAIASFNHPDGLAVDAVGNVYVVDEENYIIRKITPNGFVTTFAGNSSIGSADGHGVNASFNVPMGVALDVAGNLYIADQGNFKIRKITPQANVTTIAGNGVYGFANGPAASAEFTNVSDLKVDKTGNIYLTDVHNHMIRKIEI
jgi:serine/threonine-protein kinase